MPRNSLASPTFITLGPEGTCHEEATRQHILQQGLGKVAAIELVPGLFDDNLDRLVEALSRIRDGANSFLVQCSAHKTVSKATEWSPQEVKVVDTFMYPNRGLALLERRDVAEPRRLAVVSAALDYLTDAEKEEWDIVEESSNPDIARQLLAGEYDAGITFGALGKLHPEALRIVKDWGKVMTTWLIYGNRDRETENGWIGIKDPAYYLG